MSDKEINPLLRGAAGKDGGLLPDGTSVRGSLSQDLPIRERAEDQEPRKDLRKEEVELEGRESQQVRFLQTKSKETNFVFLFGGALRGKTVVTSSVINFLSGIESGGNLTPFRLDKRSEDDSLKDPGQALFNKIRKVFSEQRFPLRTVLVGDKEPIYINVRFKPKANLDADVLSMTFLEMPGEDLEKVDSPDGGYGELPARINAFFKVKGLSLAFILVTEPSNAFHDDQLMASFIDYVIDLDSRFESSRFLLLVTKWDTYEGELSVSDFVAENMRLTNAKLHDPRHSVASFSIGEVNQLDGKPFLKSYDPSYAKAVVNWLYMEFKGKPLYKIGPAKRVAAFIKRWL